MTPPWRRPVLATLAAILMLVAATSAFARNTNETSSDLPWIEVSLSKKQLEVHLGSDVVSTYGVAVGKDGHPTPTGEFNVRKIIWNPGWVPPPDAAWAKNAEAKKPGDPDNPMKMVKIFFQEPDYYIHGTNDPDSIGEAASHGCIRMVPKEAAEVAKYLMDHGGEPRPEPWYRRIFHSRSTRVIYLDQPVTMVIHD
ncbi:MAG: L,D-transpeptidase [Thermoanaerobaculia bacterium]